MTSGFHGGELAVQRRAGVGDEASRLAGMLDAHGTRLHVHAFPAEGDPLQGLPGGQRVGLLAIEFARRRRVRVNGALIGAGGDGLTIAVEQAYGNCPKYIQQRRLERTVPERPRTVRRSSALEAADIALIEAADTFFLGTVHPARGAARAYRWILKSLVGQRASAHEGRFASARLRGVG